MATPTLLSDLFDLVLGRSCLGCDRAGPGLCDSCLAGLRGRAGVVLGPDRLPPLVAATTYAGLGRRAILDYKEHGNRGLAPMLGTLLGDAVAVHLVRLGTDTCVIVPVPSHRHAARGFDALAAVVAAGAGHLSRQGARIIVQRPIRAGTAYRPLKGLGREQRRLQVHGAFRPGRPLRAGPAWPVLVVDDVVTSGATVGEAVRALSCVGVKVDGIATIAVVSRDTSATTPAPARPTTPR